MRTLLTEQQRADVCKMYAPDRAEQRRRESAQRQARQAPRGRFEADTVIASMFSGPWTCCGRQGARTAADSTARAARPDSASRPDSETHDAVADDGIDGEAPGGDQSSPGAFYTAVNCLDGNGTACASVGSGYGVGQGRLLRGCELAGPPSASAGSRWLRT